MPFVEGWERCVNNACGKQDWQSEVGVVSKLGYGTKIDHLSDEWLLDTKTKEGDEATLMKMTLWDTYHMQLAAGRVAAHDHILDFGVGGPIIKCGIVLVSRDHPGVAVFRSVSEDELQRGWTMFAALLAYTHASDKYKPSWAI